MGKESSFIEFINIFFSNELILILLVVLVIVLIVLISYLIKLERKENKRVLKDNLILNTEESKESFIDELNEKNNDPLGMFDSIMPTNDEETAIISADELIKASKDLSNTLQMDTSEIIDMYEEEQEKKAIISYDELLKNATSLNIKYEEPLQKEMDTPIIKKIEINENENYVSSSIDVESTNKILEYVEEEEFLKILKQFRLDLET